MSDGPAVTLSASAITVEVEGGTREVSRRYLEPQHCLSNMFEGGGEEFVRKEKKHMWLVPYHGSAYIVTVDLGRPRRVTGDTEYTAPRHKK